MISPGLFFHFFKILIFWVVNGLKGQKMAQNDKKFCLLHFISQESYTIWFPFMVHFCEMVISPGCFFHFFKILIFWVVKGQEMVQNDKKLCLPCSISQEPYIICFSFMVHMCKIWAIFSFFQNFDFLGCYGSKRAKNSPKWQKIMSVWLHISGTIYHMIIICGLQV